MRDEDLVANYYENADGLILRDAGALLGHAALVTLGLAFRILGIRVHRRWSIHDGFLRVNMVGPGLSFVRF